MKSFLIILFNFTLLILLFFYIFSFTLVYNKIEICVKNCTKLNIKLINLFFISNDVYLEFEYLYTKSNILEILFTKSWEPINISFGFFFEDLLGVCFILLITNLLTLIPILLTVAFFTICERKVLASIQRRRGPNVVGFWGILQAVADGLKLVVKEIIFPSRSNTLFFVFAPIWVLVTSFTGWALIPFFFNNFYTDFDFGILYILAISSLGVYGIILAGWSSNSRYAFLGGLRSVAQLISYEVSLGLIILPVILVSNSLNLMEIILIQQKTIWFCFPFFPLTFIFFITILAETNRTPFDLPEAEAELVAGFNVEYSSSLFALFFLGEYSSMLLMSILMVILFFGGWLPIVPFFFASSSFWLILKTIIICIGFILIRGALPRYRYDQLMGIGWKIFLPFTLGFFYFVAALLIWFDAFPYNENELVLHYLSAFGDLSIN